MSRTCMNDMLSRRERAMMELQLTHQDKQGNSKSTALSVFTDIRRENAGVAVTLSGKDGTVVCEAM